MKTVFGKKSALAIALFLSISLINGCVSANENSVKTSNETAQNIAATGEKGQAGDMPSANKAPKETKQEALVEIYDGRKFDSDKNEKEAAQTDKTFVSDEFKNSEAAIKQKLGDKYCSDPADAEVTIYNSAEGSFTKPDSKQKAYVYSVCELGRGFGVGGILIAENNAVVAHYVGQVGWSARISTLPDINKDGVSEILYADGGSGQGYTSTSVEILDFKDGNFKSLGEAQTYSDNSGAMEDQSKAETLAYKTSVQPASTPVFFRETYEKKGTAKDWSVAKKSEKFTLEKGNLTGFSKID